MDKCDDIRGIVTRTIDNIHTVIKDLRPSLVDDLGANASIKWLLDRHLADKGITYYLDIASPLTRRLPPEVEMTLFRVFQEAIINVARHAQAENAFVTVDAQRSKLEITIEDDGVGFDMHELMRQPAENGRGLGLLGMQERLALVDGKMQIHTKPGEGTRICLLIPLETEVEHV
jgi:signal transduction histidine kinase